MFVQWVRFEERKGARFDAQQDAEMAAKGIQAFPVTEVRGEPSEDEPRHRRLRSGAGVKV